MALYKEQHVGWGDKIRIMRRKGKVGGVDHFLEGQWLALERVCGEVVKQ